MNSMRLFLTPELLIEAYKNGLFPMAHSGKSAYVHWICPQERGQLPISDLHIPRRLQKTVKQGRFDVRVDTDFVGVIEGCAQARPDRPETWINDEILEAYCKLHKMGCAHSVECWLGGELVGGVYGLKIGAAFFGESMFSCVRDASKVALVHLTARLWHAGFTVFDTQFVNDHLKQFGVYEIPHEEYMTKLQFALEKQVDFLLLGKNERDIVFSYLKDR